MHWCHPIVLCLILSVWIALVDSCCNQRAGCVACGQNQYCNAAQQCACNKGFVYVEGSCIKTTLPADQFCITGRQGCMCSAVKCACQAGYTKIQKGTHFTCQNTNECSTGVAVCDPKDRVCRDTPGSYTCTCAPGYDSVAPLPGLLSCVDVNECNFFSIYHCDPLLDRCKNSIGSFTCLCRQGYLYNYTAYGCQDEDECSLGTHTCGVGQSCTNTHGSHNCACLSGYAPAALPTSGCADIDECSLGTHQCRSHLVCTNSPGSYLCLCPPGSMASAHDASQCEDVNECITNTHNCASPKTCRNLLGSYYCVCKPGFVSDPNSLSGCSDLDECVLGKHLCNSATTTCFNRIGTYTCCLHGYALRSSSLAANCLDVDECLLGTHQCSSLQTCVNTDGSFRCQCAHGLLSSRTAPLGCRDIDECSGPTSLCPGVSTCRNTFRSFRCECGAGYSFNQMLPPYCLDVDECQGAGAAGSGVGATVAPTSGLAANGSTSSTTGGGLCNMRISHCVNNMGSYRCVCNPGYVDHPSLGCQIVAPVTNAAYTDLTSSSSSSSAGLVHVATNGSAPPPTNHSAATAPPPTDHSAATAPSRGSAALVVAAATACGVIVFAMAASIVVITVCRNRACSRNTIMIQDKDNSSESALELHSSVSNVNSVISRCTVDPHAGYWTDSNTNGVAFMSLASPPSSLRCMDEYMDSVEMTRSLPVTRLCGDERPCDSLRSTRTHLHKYDNNVQQPPPMLPGEDPDVAPYWCLDKEENTGDSFDTALYLPDLTLSVPPVQGRYELCLSNHSALSGEVRRGSWQGKIPGPVQHTSSPLLPGQSHNSKQTSAYEQPACQRLDALGCSVYENPADLQSSTSGEIQNSGTGAEQQQRQQRHSAGSSSSSDLRSENVYATPHPGGRYVAHTRTMMTDVANGGPGKRVTGEYDTANKAEPARPVPPHGRAQAPKQHCDERSTPEGGCCDHPDSGKKTA
eukprot:scpid25623/ scgid29368/ Fibrillin-1